MLDADALRDAEPPAGYCPPPSQIIHASCRLYTHSRVTRGEMYSLRCGKHNRPAVFARRHKSACGPLAKDFDA
jgi:hypothetical protein